MENCTFFVNGLSDSFLCIFFHSILYIARVLLLFYVYVNYCKQTVITRDK